jgi:hypothetical protein
VQRWADRLDEAGILYAGCRKRVCSQGRTMAPRRYGERPRDSAVSFLYRSLSCGGCVAVCSECACRRVCTRRSVHGSRVSSLRVVRQCARAARRPFPNAVCLLRPRGVAAQAQVLRAAARGGGSCCPGPHSGAPSEHKKDSQGGQPSLITCHLEEKYGNVPRKKGYLCLLLAWGFHSIDR